MNIFYTNRNPVTAADEHNKVHTRKMITEYAQMASTALRLNQGTPTVVYIRQVRSVELEDGSTVKVVRLKKRNWYLLDSDFIETRLNTPILVSKKVYAVTHMNHPSNIWVRQSMAHFIWTLKCAVRLCITYKQYSGKQHATFEILKFVANHHVTLPNVELVDPPVATTAEIPLTGDTCTDYRTLMNHKFRDWVSRKKPLDVSWFREIPSWVEK